MEKEYSHQTFGLISIGIGKIILDNDWQLDPTSSE